MATYAYHRYAESMYETFQTACWQKTYVWYFPWWQFSQTKLRLRKKFPASPHRPCDWGTSNDALSLSLFPCYTQLVTATSQNMIAPCLFQFMIIFLPFLYYLFCYSRMSLLLLNQPSKTAKTKTCSTTISYMNG